MKRICTMLFAAVLVVVLMGCGMAINAPAETDSPSNQVLASVGGSSAKSMQANTASDLLRNRLGMNGDRASLVSVAGGVGLILIGCAGLYLLENT
ncbi:MAG: hypothetical protein MSB08_06315 [Subdoligranulum sp.]|nr:hypothetical protein [Subdoligranulum sp.]